MTWKHASLAAFAAVLAAGSAHAFARWGGEYADSHYGGLHGFERLCAGGEEGRIDGLLAYAEALLRPTAEQAPAWSAVADAARAAEASLRGACTELAPAETPATAPESLARAELAMAAGLEAIEGMRPALAGLYAVLSDSQRRALDDMMAHRHPL